MKTIFILITVAIVFVGHANAENDLLFSICEKGDLFKIQQSKNLSFTFHARLPDKTVERRWRWDIEKNEVFLNGVKEGASQKFINDIYWLLFPLMAHQDSDQIQISQNTDSEAPLSRKKTTELVITYVSGKGYTPNDTYKLYVDREATIIEWAYLKGGKLPPARVTTWENYQTVNGIKLSLTRESGGEFRVWFTDVVVR